MPQLGGSSSAIRPTDRRYPHRRPLLSSLCLQMRTKSANQQPDQLMYSRTSTTLSSLQLLEYHRPISPSVNIPKSSLFIPTFFIHLILQLFIFYLFISSHHLSVQVIYIYIYNECVYSHIPQCTVYCFVLFRIDQL